MPCSVVGVHPNAMRERRWLWRLGIPVVLAGAWLAFEASRIESRSAPYVRTRPESVPSSQVALVLGCSERMPDGRHNLFFVRRMAAAAELYRAGKAQYLLLSGDNSRPDYDEPSAMKGALMALGVPASRLVLDYAGFRTLDSVVRAKEVFGAQQLVIVSQRFHVVRAVYLARAHGLDAYGFEAEEVRGVGGAWPKLREVASRVFAVLDVEVFHTEPRFTGPRESTPFG
jgi:SanA protein